MTSPDAKISQMEQQATEALRTDAQRRYSYNPDTGIFRNKFNGKTMKAGDEVKTPDKHGYLRLSISGRRYKAHRIAWLLVHGNLPKMIDHINGIKTDNRIENLRETTAAGNNHNRREDTGLYKGVWKRGNSYRSSITINYKRINLGGYDTPEKAAEIYDEYALEHHGEFACINFPDKREQYFNRIAARKKAYATSPAVLALVEALKLLADKHPRCDCMDGPGIARDALTLFEESLK